MMRATICVLLTVGLLLGVGVVSADADWTESHTNEFGIVYSVSFDSKLEIIDITVKNPTDSQRLGPFAIRYDESYSRLREPLLSPGEEQTFSFNLSKGIDLTRNIHSIRVDTGKRTLQYNYTRKIKPSDTERYDPPKITDVTLENSTFQGEDRTVINVTGYNPTDRYWLLVVRAYTLETTGHYFGIQFPPNGVGNTIVTLNETPGELVVGEVRMYEDDISDPEKAFDQVEIYGRSTGSTRWSHEAYVPITPSWESDDHYVYRNESVHREKVGAPETLRESPVAWVFAGIALAYLGYRGLQWR